MINLDNFYKDDNILNMLIFNFLLRSSFNIFLDNVWLNSSKEFSVKTGNIDNRIFGNWFDGIYRVQIKKVLKNKGHYIY